MVQGNDPPALSPWLWTCSEGGTTSPLRSPSLCNAPGYMVFSQKCYLYCGDFPELLVSILLQPPCRFMVFLAQETTEVADYS